MATFKVEVVAIAIEEHTNADALELARVGSYRSVVRKGQFSTGDLVAYIPEQAIVPDALLEELGLTGRLAGKGKNRVKAVRLRGVLSQGLCVAARPHWSLGDDVGEELGIEKYVPEIPTQLAGEVRAMVGKTLKYDVENIKRFPDVLKEGEEVVMTEKLHGTWCMVGLIDDEIVISSKGQSAKGLAFVPGVDNTYTRVAIQLKLEQALRATGEAAIYVLGEVFGRGLQDLQYGQREACFRVFDVYVGRPTQGGYLSDADLDAFCETHAIERVPILYRGPLSEEALAEHTNGQESISGEGAHMREGVVVRPVVERRDDELGRVQLKSISDAYLLRKGGTEFN